MKTRLDFVSNSSSSSFIINNDNNSIAKALELWSKDFSGIDIPYQVENISVNFRVKAKNYKKVKTSLAKVFPDNDSYAEQRNRNYFGVYYDEKLDDDEIHPCSLQTSFAELPEIWSALSQSRVLEDIETLEFYGNDDDYGVILYLKMLYLYFERNHCMPDCSCSEQPFLNDDYGQNAFINKLCISD